MRKQILCIHLFESRYFLRIESEPLFFEGLVSNCLGLKAKDLDLKIEYEFSYPDQIYDLLSSIVLRFIIFKNLYVRNSSNCTVHLVGGN